MTYQLSALRFRSVGERSARFTDLCLDFTAPTDGTAVPQDSVVWLRNGGGKSSILSLAYALLLPHANDFMGRTVQRSLTDYVDSGDTSHVIAVWQPHDAGRTLLGDAEEVLVTGVVHEWADLRRPVKAAESKDKLSSHFYVFHAVPGVLDLDTLPFTDRSGRQQRSSTFLDELREQAKPHARHTGLAVTDRQHVWAKALMDRHLDPEIFRTQKQMNHVEGGVEDLFRFQAAKDFIDFLLDLATQPDTPASIATRLASVTALLAAKPKKIEERDFCTAAADDLNEVAARYQDVQSADEKRAVVTRAAEVLAAAFNAAVAAADELQRNLREQRAVLVEARTAANNERSAATDLAYLYRRKGARLRLAEVQAQEQQAATDLANAENLVRAWETTQILATAAELKSKLELAIREADAEEKELAPLRRELLRHAGMLRSRLESLADQADAAAAAVDDEVAVVDETRAAQEELAKQARSEATDAASNQAQARTQLEILEQRCREGVERGHLPSRSTPPQDHLNIVRVARTELERQRRELTMRVEDRRRRRAEIAIRDTELAGEHSGGEGARTDTVTRRAGLKMQLAELTGSQRLRDLAEVVDDEIVDLWTEGSILRRRLGDAIIAVDDERILRHAEQHADRRTIEAQERNQVLPSSLDAERIARELIDAGIPAQTGWAHLRSVVPAADLVAALNIGEIATLGCGVIVPTGRVAEAVRLLEGRLAVTTSFVGVYTAESADVLIRDGSEAPPSPLVTAAWFRLQQGLVDATEAELAVRLLKERAHAHTLKDQELVRQHRSDEELVRGIGTFLSECPAGHITVLDEEIERLDRRLQDIEEEQDHNREELLGLDATDELEADRREALDAELRKADATVSWLEDVIPALADEGLWRGRLEAARLRAEDADRRAEMHSANALQAFGESHQWRTVADQQRRSAGEYRSERDRLPEKGQAETADDRSTPLDALRRRHQEANKAVETRAAQSVLADRVRTLTESAATAREELGRRPAEQRAAAEHLLSSPEGQEPQLRTGALIHAQMAARAAAGEHGAAGAEVERCRSSLDKVLGLYRQPPRRTLPAIPADADEAVALAGEQETRSQLAQEQVADAERHIDRVDEQTRQADNRKNLFGALLESLPEARNKAAEPFTEDDLTARNRAREARDAVTAAAQTLISAEKDLNGSVDRIRRTASRFGGISGPIKDRVANDPPALLGPHAEQLSGKLRLRAQTLEDELGSIAQDQAIISDALAHLVKDSLDMLAKAERASLMKTASGSWSGKKVLRIGFDRPSDADLVVYADRVIDRLVEKGLKPEGMPLLKAAIHEAAGPRGFVVKVLKPTDDATSTTEDISRLAKWSGGEKLTVCVALYCTLASLRAARTGRRGRSGGVLLLDNPIGRASSASLVRLQRDVAASHGVQLIYTTGVKDPAAVIQFPNVIRLDNREGRTRNRRYIVPETGIDSDDMGGTGFLSGIRVAHADHPWDAGESVVPEGQGE